MALSTLGGWSTGFHWSTARNKELEVKQGGNYYFSAASQLSQVGSVAVAFSHVANAMQWTTLAIPIAVNIAPIAIALPLLLGATLKHGNYNTVTEVLNQFPRKGYFQIPKNLSERSIRILNFLVEKTGTIMQAAMLVSTIALFALGQTYFAAAMLAAVSYQALDSRGWVPYRVSRPLEKYLPVIASVGMLFTGSLVMQAVSVLRLASYIPTLKWAMLEKTDLYLRGKYPKLMRLGPDLPDLQKPLMISKNLTMEEIKRILRAPSTTYEINPSHCAAPTLHLGKLPRDGNFDKLLTRFNQINWDQRFPLIKSKLLDDEERFIPWLKANHPEWSKERLSKEKDLPIPMKSALLTWFKEQMIECVDVLMLRRAFTGTKADLEDAREQLSYFVPYVEKLDAEKDRVELEDILLKLAVEGGGYCSRGIKRASSELLSLERLQKMLGKKIHCSDPLEEYELQLNLILEARRAHLLQNFYNKMMGGTFQAIQGDVHTLDLFKSAIALGFTPLTDKDKWDFSIGSFLFWELCGMQPLRSEMYGEYRRGQVTDLDPKIRSLREKLNDFVITREADGRRSLKWTNTELTLEARKQVVQEVRALYLRLEAKGYSDYAAKLKDALDKNQDIDSPRGWNSCKNALSTVLRTHRPSKRFDGGIDSLFSQVAGGENKFTEYMQGVVEKNTKLTRDQKDQVLDWLTANDPTITPEQFHQLAFVMLGVLREKKPSLAPISDVDIQKSLEYGRLTVQHGYV